MHKFLNYIYLAQFCSFLEFCIRFWHFANLNIRKKDPTVNAVKYNLKFVFGPHIHENLVLGDGEFSAGA